MVDRSRITGRLLLLAMLALLAVAVVGLVAGEQRPRDRAAELERQLRCPVCKQVSITDSPSETAAAMRRAVAEQVAAGRSDAEVLGYFQARYGEWVLLDPDAGGRGLWLWVLPAAAAAGGVVFVATQAARQKPAPAPVSPHERDRIAAELARLRSRPVDAEDVL